MTQQWLLEDSWAYKHSRNETSRQRRRWWTTQILTQMMICAADCSAFHPPSQADQVR